MAKKIDFKNKTLLKLRSENIQKGFEVVKDLLLENEQVIASYVSIRDRLVFTNGRIISVNVQGITGSKIDFTSIPYKKIQMYSVETAGTIDLDTEFIIWISGMGEFKFELSGDSDIIGLSKLISRYIL